MIRTNRFRSDPGKKVISGINITPFTDVCLVLLIIFMVTYPALMKAAAEKERGFQMNLPKASTADVSLPNNAVVRITRDAKLYLNNKPTTMATLGAELQQQHDAYGTRLLVVKADEGIPYKLVISTIDIARKAGLDQIGLATREAGSIEAPPVSPSAR